MDLTTKAEVKKLLKKETGASTDIDARIDQQITAVSGQVEGHLSRFNKEEERTFIFDTKGGQKVWWLPAYPFKAGATFEARHALDGDFSDALTVVDTTTYFTNDRRGYMELRRGVFLSSGPQSMQLKWTGGLGATEAAVLAAFPEISGAVNHQVAWLIQRGQEVGVTSFSADGGSVTLEDMPGLLRGVRTMLERHRRRSSSR